MQPCSRQKSKSVAEPCTGIVRAEGSVCFTTPAKALPESVSGTITNVRISALESPGGCARSL